MKPEHLGDGAYVSETAEGLVLTANHHLESHATDRVYLDTRGVTNLKRYIESWEREHGFYTEG